MSAKSIALSLLLSATQGSADAVCGALASGVSCGLTAAEESTCLAAGCCWLADTGCTTPSIPGYGVTNVTSQTGLISGDLSLIESSGIFGGANEFDELKFEIVQQTNGRTHISIDPVSDPNRWRIPSDLLPNSEGFYTDGAPFPGGFYTEARVTSTAPFGFEVERINGGVNPIYNDVIFNFTKSMVYLDQYLQFTLTSHEDVMATYGFGESTRAVQQLQEGKVYTLWATDVGAFTFDAALYGAHPFVIQVLSSGKAHGFMFLNSNAMELTLTTDENGRQNVVIQSTGGAMDIYVFGGPTPEEVIRQYLEVIGRPALVPHWSLGFHNCRWGYSDVQYVEDVVANYTAADIPLQTQWMDIDYMDKYLDFTLDPNSFSLTDMTAFIDDLHKNGQNFVPIIDPGIYVRDPTYETYTSAMESNVFIMDMERTNPYLGQVWPGPTYFPDWFAPNTSSWWMDEFAHFRDLVSYDGIWIDMNEVANFCNLDGTDQVCSLDPNNSCPDNECCLDCATVDPTNEYDFPPFVPHVYFESLGGKTVSMNSYHHGDILEYNAHSLFGFMESIATNNAVATITGERPFILSRSTFMGSGKYTAHWTGDNAATWADLAASIITMNNFALFGVPMIGADICGFAEDTTEELCNRWIQVGAFSPFSRNHNIEGALPQELYRWDSVAESSRMVLRLRYQLLPHLYTLMFNAHFFGNTVHNAMWMHFPHDPEAHTHDAQYMWAGSILFTPVVVEGATSVEGYFPYGMWYSLLDDSVIDCTEGGKSVTLHTPANATNVHVRGGHIVTMQDYANTTEGVRASPFTLVVALGHYKVAGGALFFDDGKQLEIEEATYVVYESDHEVLRSMAMNTSYALPTAWVRTVEVWGIEADSSDCSASIEFPDDTDDIDAASVELMEMNGYQKLVISFDEENAVNIAASYELSWSCGDSSSSSSSSSQSGDGSDDDASIMGLSEDYEVGLAITAIAVAGIAVIGGIAYGITKIFRGSSKDDSLFTGEGSNAL